MDFDPAELDALSREDLILRARARGVERPEQMTRVELRDEIVRVSEPDLERQRRSRGWLGVARDLLASVVESGLNLPDAAAAIRGDAKDIDLHGPPPVATVTLAEIYAAQGHYEQALRMLDEVIEREPEHTAARSLHQRLTDERDLGPGRRKRVVATTTAAPSPAPPPVAPLDVPVLAPIAAAPQPEPAAIPAPAIPAMFEAAPATPEPAPAATTPEPAPVTPEPAPTTAPPLAPEAAPMRATPEPEPARAPLATAASPAEGSSAAPAPAGQVLVLHTSDRAFVYWRLPAISETVCLRSLTVRPATNGPRVSEEDHRLPVLTGGFWLPRFERGTEVRAALGELSTDGFTPLLVARVVSEESEATFEPPGIIADAELEAAARRAAGL